MRFHLPVAGLLITAAALAFPPDASAQGFFPGRQIGARVWVENDRDYFRRGDRLDVRFTLSDDAYVAIVHVDPEGYLEFVYPASPWDNEYVRGGRVHSLPLRGSSGWRVRGQSGIGYFYLIASPSPLDFGRFRGRAGSPWDWGYAGHVVRGDPFLAFQQISSLLLPWPSTPYVDDHYGYHVGGIHRYPSYACSDRYSDYSSGWGWSPSFGSCSRMDYFLRDYPYYYDTRRYRGDRRAYLGRYDRLDPLHGYKEDPERPADRRVTPRPQSDRRDGARSPGSTGTTAPDRGIQRRDPVAPRAEPQRAPEPETRSAPERRAAPADRSRPRPEPSAEPSRDAPASQPSSSNPGRRPTVGGP